MNIKLLIKIFSKILLSGFGLVLSSLGLTLLAEFWPLFSSLFSATLQKFKTKTLINKKNSKNKNSFFYYGVFLTRLNEKCWLGSECDEDDEIWFDDENVLLLLLCSIRECKGSCDLFLLCFKFFEVVFIWVVSFIQNENFSIK